MITWRCKEPEKGKNQMKKTIVLALLCLLLLVSLVFSTLILTIDNENGSHGDGQNEGSAFIIWGTLDYADETYMGGETERNASRDVCDTIYGFFVDTHGYGYYENFWGNDTQPEQVYSNVSYCEENYNFTAIFYKGHSIGTTCDVENCTFGEHWTLYAAEGYEEEYIIDYLIHDRMSSGTHDFVFLWTCGYGSEDKIGEIDENGHSVGMLASWMDTTGLEADGYASPDGSNHCFIGFDIYSIWFTNKTGYADFDYGDFVSLFFEYALYEGWTINDALDAAAEETHWQSSFGDCQLYTGYLMADPDNPGQSVMCYMRVWGDGNLKLLRGE
jgi:hypothetical protein